MYFLLKLTRYSIMFWTPLYLVEHLGMDSVAAGRTSSWYELVGFLGAVFAGYAMPICLASLTNLQKRECSTWYRVQNF